MGHSFIIIGAICAALAVTLGAFAAHALKSRLDANMLAVFQTGVEYQFYHALGLLVIGMLLMNTQAPPGIKTAGWLLFAGIILFSGSLYALTLSGQRVLGMITPFGGLAFILGWLWLAWVYWKS